MKKIVFIFVTFVILLLSVRGNLGNTTEQNINNISWTENGPLELSPERGRYSLLMSIVENKSFHFSLPLARLATPDLGYKDGNYVSLFAPGVSFLVMPGYLLGKVIGASQVGTYLIVSLFALINFMLIGAIATKFGANKFASIVAGLIFLFGTPAFAYGVSLYQHHISTFLILAAIYILLNWNNWLSASIIWFLCAMSIPVDYPNLFLMFPIGVYALGNIVTSKIKNYSWELNVKWKNIFTFMGVVLPLLFFGWFSQKSYNNPLQLSGTVSSVKSIDVNGKPAATEGLQTEDVEKFINPDTQKKSAVSFFKTRNIINGLYIHLFSPDRGVIYYAPAILFGIFGMIIVYKKRHPLFSSLLGIVLINILLYSMWGDPWGGWAFGSRYLIPTYAIMAIFVGIFVTEHKKDYLVMVVFMMVIFYSVAVNTMGALTSNTNPPKVEILALEKQTGRVQKYTFERNWEMLISGSSKSFVFQTFAEKHISAMEYFRIIFSLICILTTVPMIKMFVSKNEN